MSKKYVFDETETRGKQLKRNLTGITREREDRIVSIHPIAFSLGLYGEMAASKPRKNEETFVLAPRSSSLLGRNRSLIPNVFRKSGVRRGVCGSGYKVRRTSRQTRDAFCAGNVVGSVQKLSVCALTISRGETHFRGQFSQVDPLINGA